jgi:hypothetical protein
VLGRASAPHPWGLLRGSIEKVNGGLPHFPRPSGKEAAAPATPALWSRPSWSSGRCTRFPAYPARGRALADSVGWSLRRWRISRVYRVFPAGGRCMGCAPAPPAIVPRGRPDVPPRNKLPTLAAVSLVACCLLLVPCCRQETGMACCEPRPSDAWISSGVWRTNAFRSSRVASNQLAERGRMTPPER